MEFQPGDRVYHTRKRGYATVVYQITKFTTLIEFDDKIGEYHPKCKPGYAWRADTDLLQLVSEAPDDTPINIENLI